MNVAPIASMFIPARPATFAFGSRSEPNLLNRKPNATFDLGIFVNFELNSCSNALFAKQGEILEMLIKIFKLRKSRSTSSYLTVKTSGLRVE